MERRKFTREFKLEDDSAMAPFGEYRPVCAIGVENVGLNNLDACLVEMVEFSGVRSDGMPMPLVLRTDGQIRADERGRFLLSRRQKTIVPLVFRSPTRANEWFFIDETGNKHFVPANPTKIIVRIHGGATPGKALIFIDLDAGWNAMPSIKTAGGAPPQRLPRRGSG